MRASATTAPATGALVPDRLHPPTRTKPTIRLEPQRTLTMTPDSRTVPSASKVHTRPARSARRRFTNRVRRRSLAVTPRLPPHDRAQPPRRPSVLPRRRLLARTRARPRRDGTRVRGRGDRAPAGGRAHSAVAGPGP